MGRFLTELRVLELGGGKRQLLEDLEYETDSGYVIVVPEGFVTDYFSVPRPLWAFFPRDGKGKKASALHDFLYGRRGAIPTKHYSRKRCDRAFLEAMKAESVSWWRRQVMYRAVRDWGWIAWNKG